MSLTELLAARASAPRRRSGLGRHDRHGLAAALGAELHRARGEREERVVATAADQVARVELGAPLADEDLAGADDLTAEPLHAQALSGGVTTVTGAGRTLFVCHFGTPTSRW